MTDPYALSLACLKFSFLVLASSSLDNGIFWNLGTRSVLKAGACRAPCCPRPLGRSILGGDGERASLEAPAEGARGLAKRSAAKPGELLRGGPAPAPLGPGRWGKGPAPGEEVLGADADTLPSDGGETLAASVWRREGLR